MPSSTGFLDLPAELCDEIYRLALVHDHPIRVTRLSTGQKTMDVEKATPEVQTVGGSGTVIESQVRRKLLVERQRARKIGEAANKAAKPEDKCKSSTIILVKGKGRRKVAASKALNTALLRANKKIHLEASTTLYRENQFVFDRPCNLAAFCASIGDTKAAALANITIKDLDSPVAREQICVLSKVLNPERMALPAQVGYGRVNWLRSAWDAQKTREVIRPVVWLSTEPKRAGMSLRPRLPEQEQLRRLNTIHFNVLSCGILRAGDEEKEEVVQSLSERKERFKEMVKTCWRRDSSLLPRGRKRGGDAEIQPSGGKRLKPGGFE